MNRRIPLQPAEGWVVVALIGVMAVTIGWSLDDPGWVMGEHAWTDFLPLAAVLGALAGLVGAKVRWSRWVAHLMGAAFAALILPVFVGWIDHPDASLGQAFTATALASVEAWTDLSIRRLPTTPQTLHSLLALGILAWATGQAMSYAVFGHRRPLDAVVVGGLLLLVNMAATFNDQLHLLVIFSGASLFLLVTMHALDERMTWIRRRIGDPSAISRLYLSGGTVFIVIAMIGSLVLMDRAASAPLADAWTGVDGWLYEVSDDLQGLLPQGGDQRGGPVSFGSQSRVTGRWYQNNDTAFTAKPPSLTTDHAYWQTGTWDEFEFPNVWNQSEPSVRTPIESNAAILDGVIDAPDPERSDTVSIPVTLDGYLQPLLLSAGIPMGADIATTLVTTPEGQYVGVSRSDQRQYTVTSLVWKEGEDGLTAARLREASIDYPADIIARYTGGWEQSLPEGGAAMALRDDILAGLTDPTPYDIADAIETRLRSSEFEYSTNVTDLPCNRDGLAECFAAGKRGYCMHYATTMVMMLRSLDIPARLPQGFLPGKVDLGTGIETVAMSNAHAWVEVYFPGYGWQPFDPTGGAPGSEAQSGALPPGTASGSPTPRPSGSRPDPDTPRPSLEEPDDEPGGAIGRINRPGDPSTLILTGALLLIIFGGIASIAWWRGPRGEITPDVAWGTVGRLAARFGFAPRPTQTVYEFAGALGQVVPVARPDLETVARAKVEVVYGRGRLSKDRMRQLREANRRLRVSLLRLVLRRRPGGVRRIRP